MTEPSDGGSVAADQPEDTDPATLAMIDARYATISNRFRDTWSAEQRDLVRKRIKQILGVSDALHQTPLKNHDEPEIVFAPYRGTEIETGTGESS